MTINPLIILCFRAKKFASSGGAGLAAASAQMAPAVSNPSTASRGRFLGPRQSWQKIRQLLPGRKNGCDGLDQPFEAVPMIEQAENDLKQPRRAVVRTKIEESLPERVRTSFYTFLKGYRDTLALLKFLVFKESLKTSLFMKV